MTFWVRKEITDCWSEENNCHCTAVCDQADEQHEQEVPGCCCCMVLPHATRDGLRNMLLLLKQQYVFILKTSIIQFNK